MVETLVIKAEKRQGAGTRAARKLRRQGLVPAVIYGHQKEPVAIQLNYHDVALEIQHRHLLLEVELDGEREKLLVKEVQYDHMYEKIIHVDLTRVSMDERVRVTVPVELRGSAAGTVDGGVLEQALSEVQLECPVTSIPENIRVTITGLQVGEALLAKDIELPPGSQLLTDPATVVAALRMLAEELEPEEAKPEEPEMITRPTEEETEEKTEQKQS